MVGFQEFSLDRPTRGFTQESHMIVFDFGQTYLKSNYRMDWTWGRMEQKDH